MDKSKGKDSCSGCEFINLDSASYSCATCTRNELRTDNYRRVGQGPVLSVSSFQSSVGAAMVRAMFAKVDGTN